MMWKSMYLNENRKLGEQLVEFAQDHPEVKKFQVSLFDFTRADWRHHGLTLELAVKTPYPFLDGEEAPVSLDYRRVSVEASRDVTPGFARYL